jgi:hypothetical protein
VVEASLTMGGLKWVGSLYFVKIPAKNGLAYFTLFVIVLRQNKLEHLCAESLPSFILYFQKCQEKFAETNALAYLTSLSPKQARSFTSGDLFEPNLYFASKAVAYLSDLSFRCSTLGQAFGLNHKC